MRTLDDIIIAKRNAPVDKIGLIHVPQCVIDADRNERERGVLFGTVTVAGPKCDLKPGDRILYHRSQFIQMDYLGEDFCCFHEKHVLAKVD